MSVPRGQRVGLFGHNGCGKSTLLKACVGVHKTMTGSGVLQGQDALPGAVPRNAAAGCRVRSAVAQHLQRADRRAQSCASRA